MATGNSKKAFDFTRDSIWACDPKTELCIVGGDTLDNAERGDLDVSSHDAGGREHPLYDPAIRDALDPALIHNIDAYGVIEPVVITKLDGIAVVVDGRTRVRAARVVNARRYMRGEQPIKVRAVQRRDDEGGLIGVMIAANEGRRRADDVLAKLAKAKRLIVRGIGHDDVAKTFAVSRATLEGWLALEDHGTDETKRAIADGRVSPTAAAELARVRDPDKQREALASMLSAPGKKTTLAARRAVAQIARPKLGGGDGVGIHSRRSIRKLLDTAVAMTHSNASKETYAWWQGVEELLKALCGEDVSERVQTLIDKAEL